MKETHDYDDIIELEHHVSKTHKQMSREARAAQFAPFAALTGHDEAVKETARLTENKKIIDENFKSILDEKLLIIEENIKNKPKITISYFIPDNKKEGGKYETITGNVKKIDDINKSIILTSNVKVPLEDIIEINI